MRCNIIQNSMKLTKFIGKNVRGYIDFSIEFRDSVTFLIGINGAGKTTALQLIEGLLRPDFYTLTNIAFSFIELCGRTSDNKKFQISCEKNTSTITIKYKQWRFVLADSFKIDFDKSSELYKETEVKFSNSATCSHIKSFKTPVFIGLNRRAEFDGYDQRRRYMREERMRMQYAEDDKWRRSLPANDRKYDSTLQYIQECIYDVIRYSSKTQSDITESFKQKIISESISISDMSYLDNALNSEKELQKIEKRKQDLEQACKELNISYNTMKYNKFFNEMKKALNVLATTNDNDTNKEERLRSMFTWITNVSQLKKIDKIIDYANEYTQNINELKRPINNFVEAANLFYKEGGKLLSVNNTGEIIVSSLLTGSTCSIFELSSGEKQIIKMLAYLSFYETVSAAPIFIIDEPELSLHLSWQELFVDALLKANPNIQYIMATHAPAIIAKNNRKEWCQDLSLKRS